jgi:hypothetical protein
MDLMAKRVGSEMGGPLAALKRLSDQSPLGTDSELGSRLNDSVLGKLLEGEKKDDDDILKQSEDHKKEGSGTKEGSQASATPIAEEGSQEVTGSEQDDEGTGERRGKKSRKRTLEIEDVTFEEQTKGKKGKKSSSKSIGEGTGENVKRKKKKKRSKAIDGSKTGEE